MIERTAASLEPRGIGRALPLPSRPQSRLRSARRLHSSFWHHSAVDLELSNVFQVLVGAATVITPALGTSAFASRNNAASIAHRVSAALAGDGITGGDGTVGDGHEGSRKQRHNGVYNPSPFLLEFLGPGGGLVGTPRMLPSFFSPLDRGERYRPGPSPRVELRPYTSSTTEAPAPEPNSVADRKYTESSSKLEPPSQTSVVQTIAGEMPQLASPTNALQAFLAKKPRPRDPPENFDKVRLLWEKAEAIDGCKNLRKPVFQYLCEAARTPEHLSILNSQLHEIPRKHWDRVTLSCLIHAHFRTTEDQAKALESAVRCFHVGLEADVVGGLGLLISKLLVKGRFQELIDLVLQAASAMERRGTGLPRQRFDLGTPSPEIIDQVIQLSRYIDENYKDAFSSQRTTLDGLVQSFAGHLTDVAPVHILIPLVTTFRSQKLVHKVLLHHLSTRNYAMAANVYRLYRQLPGVRVNNQILEEMFDVFAKRGNTSGLEELLADWRRHHQRMSIPSYIKFLTFYSRRGDLASTEKLWNEFIAVQKLHIEKKKGGVGKLAKSTFALMLNAYAERGDLSDAKRFFREMSRDITPNRVCWNILLKAHKESDDYAGALEVFRKIGELYGEPELPVLRTMVGMAGARGDLEFVLSLVNAQKSASSIDMKMMASVVEALCQNEQYKDAEATTIDATKEIRGNAVHMWNMLLQQSALRHDLANLSRLLGLMSEHKVKYNSTTYTWLLRCLGLCGQTQHALQLLNTAIKDDAFHITAEHYLIVFSSALGTRDVALSMKILDLIRSPATPLKTAEMLSEVSALKTWSKLRQYYKYGLSHQDFVASTLATFGRCMGRLANKEHMTKQHLIRPEDVEKMVSFCVLMKDFSPARDLIGAFKQAYPPEHFPERYTHRLYNALIMAYIGDRNFVEIDRTWLEMLESMKSTSRVRGRTSWSKLEAPKVGQRMVASFQRGITSMMRSCLLRDDPHKLKAVVKEVRAAGFELNNTNWNLYVQYLARLQQYTEAFKLCEAILMPGWPGWHKRVWGTFKKLFTEYTLTVETRQKLASKSFLSPSKMTILVLAKAFIDLEAAAAYSTRKAEYSKEMAARHGRTMIAIRNLGRLTRNESWMMRNPKFYGKDVVAAANTKADEDAQKASASRPDHGSEPTAFDQEMGLATQSDVSEADGSAMPAWEGIDWDGGVPEFGSALDALRELDGPGAGEDADGASHPGATATGLPPHVDGDGQPSDSIDLSSLTGGSDNWQDINKTLRVTETEDEPSDDEGATPWADITSPDDDDDGEEVSTHPTPYGDGLQNEQDSPQEKPQYSHRRLPLGRGGSS